MTAAAPVGSRQVMVARAKKSGFRPDIQGLRMIAVVAVILDHLIAWPAGGFVGVDIFFVISGFLITGLLLREHEQTGTISFRGFYRRRVKRIIPVAVMVIALVVLAAWFVFNRTRFWGTFWDGFYAMIFTANWHFAAVGTDYFQAESAVSPLQHYWSLSVEEQFYFVWPWVMLLIFALSARLFGWTHRTARGMAGVVMVVITVGSFAWSLWETSQLPTWAYFSTLSRAWELGVGALIAVFAGVLSRVPRIARPILGWAGLIGILVSLFVVNAESAFPAPWAVLPVLSTAVVIIAGTGGEQRFMWPLTNPVSRYVGDISYSLYVWHWPIIVFGTLLLGNAPLTLLCLLLIIVAVSTYSYHFFEDPIRRSGWLEPRPDRRRRRSGRVGWNQRGQVGLSILIAGLTAVLVTAALARPTVQVDTSAYRPPSAPSATPTSAASAGLPELATLQSEISTALQARSYPSDLRPTMDEAMNEPQAPLDVLPCGFAGATEARCTFGGDTAEYTALLVGNSVSMTYVAPIMKALGPRWRVVAYGMFGCPFDDYGREDVSKLGVVPDGCEQRPDDAVEAVNRLAPSVIFVSGVGSQAKAELAKIAVDTTVMFLPGPPTGETNVRTCYSPLNPPSECVTTQAPDWAGQERSLVAAVPGSVLVDSWNWFCSERRCPAFVGTTPTRIDVSHMTHEYGERIVPVMREWFATSPVFRGLTE